MFHKSLVFQVMPTFKSRKSNMGLFSEQNLNKGLDDVLTNAKPRKSKAKKNAKS